MINRYDNLVIATNSLKERGFTNSYKLKQGRLHCFENNRIYSADDVKIVEYHRFEGMTDPGSSSVIFALQAKDGSKGTIISTYGAYMDAGLTSFLDNVKILIRESAY